MVGGLADWFAVTALFRHPLGLPIPHTAIIPRNKDRIGEALASFLEENFLIASVVARRMRNIDMAGAAGRFLRRPGRRRDRIRHGASRLIADIFEGLDDERFGGIVKSAISSRLKHGGVAAARPCAGVGDQRGPPCANARGGDPLVGRELDSNESLIREMVHKRGELSSSSPGSNQARRRDHGRLAQADGRNVDRPRAPVRARRSRKRSPPRQRPPDQARNPGSGSRQ